MTMIDITSAAFQPDGLIPSKYTCDGGGISPPLTWSNIPDRTRSVAILVDDPDSADRPFLHWLVTDVPPEVHRLEEGGALPREANVGESDAGTASYYGPCPSSGRHHYRFHVYALDTVLGRRPESREDFLSAIDGHVLDEGELVASYARPSS
ncbi:MAG TPA: YbhB/YbcL family Raf kinase inhibitor-like protein [Kofleriaceae bacterium]|nr:YbhB/YbcL family Raf kinase inhibitor-like protein [Kofleriaceae bacterium]